MKTILVPVDFSPVTRSMLDVAASLATDCGARIMLVHVAPAFVADLKNVRIPQHERDLVADELRQEHRDLQALADELTKRECDVEALLVEGGGTVEKILDESQRLRADLVVMGSHGHGRLYDMLIGSTCEGVLRKARIPLLIVPAVADTAENDQAAAGSKRSDP